jgi:hypothetical protein
MTDLPVHLEAPEDEAGKQVGSVRGSAHKASTANDPGSYAGHSAVLATMHGKEAAISAVLFDRLGLIVDTVPNLDTDVLGTFTGEVPRTGTIRETAIAKARLGMAASKLSIGIASEGSYGPHPHIPFVAGGIELMVLVDDSREIIVTEHLIEDTPIFDHAFAYPHDELGAFLNRIGFPDHALIVKAAEAGVAAGPVYKGLRSMEALALAISRCAAHSRDGRALIQTDMRAHMNPTRMATLRRLAAVFAERVATPCPACAMPGYGLVDVETGLPCEACGTPSIMVRHQVFGCVACEHRERRPRIDGRSHADPGHCPICNP